MVGNDNEWAGHDLTWVKNEGEDELKPRHILTVDLPWLPQDSRTQVILVAASKVKALLSLDLYLGRMERPTLLGLSRDEMMCGRDPLTVSSVRAGLNQLPDGAIRETSSCAPCGPILGFTGCKIFCSFG